MTTITVETLDKLPDRTDPDGRSAYLACTKLGGLAPWMLHPDVLRSAYHDRSGVSCEPLTGRVQEVATGVWVAVPPHLPRTPGTCGALVVFQDEFPRSLHRGFVLPLQWRLEEDCGRLPRDLRVLAQRIKTDTLRVSDRRWNLHLHPDVDVSTDGPLDLSGLGIDPASAGVSLAAALHLADQNLQADPTVFASAKWDDTSGAGEVDYLEHKFAAAKRHHATTVFVCDTQANGGRELLLARQHGLELRGISERDWKYETALANYIRMLEDQPDPARPGVTLEACSNYFLRQDPRSRRGIEYYRTKLLPKLTGKLGQLFTDPTFRLTHLVTFVSNSPELILLMARAIPRLERVTALVGASRVRADDDTIRALREQLQAGDERPPIAFDTATFPDQTDTIQALRGVVGNLTASAAPEGLVLDITPGTARMKWLADRGMPKRSWRVFLDTKYDDEKNRTIPGTEQPVVWRVD